MKEFKSLSKKRMTSQEKNVIWSQVQFHIHTRTHIDKQTFH